MAALPGVSGANLNTTTGRLTVTTGPDGSSTAVAPNAAASDAVESVYLEQIRRLGRSEDYTIETDEQRTERRRSGDADAGAVERAAAKAEFVRVLVAGVLLLSAWLLERSLSGSEGADVTSSFIVNVPFVLYFGAIVVGGWSNARRAFYALPRLDFNMSVLMTVAVIGAMAIGEWTEGAVVAFLFAVSDMLEAWTYDRARRSIRDLMESTPKRARVRRSHDGVDSEVDISVEDIVVGDIVVIRPGEKIPVDGTVTIGRSAVEEAAITGESIPAEKEPGAAVFAATLNTYGALEVRATRPFAETTIAKIVNLVEEAEASRPASQAFVDRFAAVYTPIVMALAALIAVGPPLVIGAEWAPWIYRGLALLVVACPCALVVATPVSVVSAISNAARRGVLVKGGVYLEQLAGVEAFAFDKTGTLTTGKPVVTDVVPFADANGDGRGATDESDLLQMAVDLESRSEHPIAGAIVQRGAERGILPVEVANFEALTGRGVKGEIGMRGLVPDGGAAVGSPSGDGAVAEGRAGGFETVYAGNRRLFAELGSVDAELDARLAELQEQGKTTIIVGTAERVYGLIAVADEPRSDAAATIAALKRAGVSHTAMLTGDNERAAKTIASALGIDDVRAELLPEHKVQAVTELLDAHGRVAMVGDGVNDAPALATATVGIAMGGAGTDAALETADVVLMGDDLGHLPYITRLSRSMLRIIKQNINFSIAIKVVAILAVFPGWLTLWLAILADMGATVIVTLNGMRLLGHGRRAST